MALRPSAHRALTVAAFRRLGIDVVPGAPHDRATLEVSEEQDAIVLRSGTAELCRLSSTIRPDDLAQVVLMAIEWREDHRELAERTASSREAMLLAHDANNALTAMFTALALLEREDGSVARSLVHEIRSAAGSIAEMMRTLLTGGRSSPPQSIDVNAMISGFESSLRRVTQPSVLVLRLAAELPLTRMTPVDLERSVLNLLRNARAATSAGCEIVLSTAFIHVEPDEDRDLRPGRWVAIAVEDPGSEMDEATWRNAMESLSSFLPPHGEHGYGLASVARAARAAGGYVTIRSSPGAGTRVCIVLPACDS